MIASCIHLRLCFPRFAIDIPLSPLYSIVTGRRLSCSRNQDANACALMKGGQERKSTQFPFPLVRKLTIGANASVRLLSQAIVIIR